MAQSIKLGSNTYLDASGVVDGQMTFEMTVRQYTNDIDPTYTDLTHSAYIYRMGKMRTLMLNVHVTGSFPSNTLTNMITLDTEDLPHYPLFAGYCSQEGYPGLITVSGNVVQLFKGVSNTNPMWFRGSWTYFVA